MDTINYETIKSAIIETFPEFDQAQIEQVSLSLMEHLYEYAKGLIYEEDELELFNKTEALVFESEQDTKRLFQVLQKKLSSLPNDEQQAIQALMMKELIERGHQLFKAVHHG